MSRKYINTVEKAVSEISILVANDKVTEKDLEKLVWH